MRRPVSTIAARVFVSAQAILGFCHYVAGEELSATDVARRYTASYTALHTIQGSYRLCYRVDGNLPDPLPSNVKVIDGGLFVLQEYEWKEDNATKARRLDGVFGFRHEGDWTYQAIQQGFDGIQARSFNPVARNARQGPPGDWIWNTRTPLTLVGQGITIDSRGNLPDLLQEATLVKELNELPTDIVLRTIVTDESRPLEVTVWIDASRGFLPRRIETRSPGAPVRSSETIVDDSREVAPGVWVPIRGRARVYAQSATYGDGISQEQYEQLPFAEQKRLEPTCKPIEVPLGLGEATFLVDVDSLKINHPIESSAFVVEYPNGTQVWDETQEPPVSYTHRNDIPPDALQEIVRSERQRRDKQIAQQRTLIGQHAPPLPQGEWLNTKALTWEDLRGRIVILKFLSMDCGPCFNEVAALKEQEQPDNNSDKESKPADTIIGVHTSTTATDEVRALLEKHALRAPVCIDSPDDGGHSFGAFFAACHINEVPMSLAVDEQGQVLAMGSLPDVMTIINEHRRRTPPRK